VIASVFLVQGPLFKSPKNESAPAKMQAQLEQPQPSDHLTANPAPAAEAKPVPKTSRAAASRQLEGDRDAIPSRLQAPQEQNEERAALADSASSNAPLAAAPPPPAALAKDKKTDTEPSRDDTSGNLNTVQVTSAPLDATAEAVPSRNEQGNLAFKAAKQRPEAPNKTEASKAAPAFSLARARNLAPLWSVDAEGHLQHVVKGVSQPVAVDPAAHFLVVAFVGENIWVGGRNLALYHSADNGAHWQRQTVPATAPADIVRLQAASALELTLQTSAQQTFLSRDGGTTWTYAPAP
jgi:hypothetical protein